MLRKLVSILAFALMLVIAPTSCTIIDDDRSDCVQDFTVHYEVTLHTNLSTQVQTVLRNRAEMKVADILMDSLKNIFREYASDVELSFYIDNDRKYHDEIIVNSGQKYIELDLPADNYRHLALANLKMEPQVIPMHNDRADVAYLSQVDKDTIDIHSVGFFSARKDINILYNVDQVFDVSLYMVNCASILVVCTDNVAYRDMKVYSSDFANGFYVNDSVFTYTANPIVRDHRISTPPTNRELFYAVTFPSCDTAEQAQTMTRAGDETVGDDKGRIWRKFVYVTMPDGSVTRTVVNATQPLLAGQATIVYAYLKPNGGIVSPNVDVSTSIQLNWKDGLEIEY